jgi:hypothetical protein
LAEIDRRRLFERDGHMSSRVARLPLKLADRHGVHAGRTGSGSRDTGDVSRAVLERTVADLRRDPYRWVTP